MTDIHQAVALAPSENWDADFEFQQGNQPAERDVSSERMSITSNTISVRIRDHISREEDWGDDDEAFKQVPPTAGPSHGNNTDLSLFSHPKMRFSDWSESSPSTPTKHSNRTESWDDDFEDKQDSPVRSKLSSHHLDAGRSAHMHSDTAYHNRCEKSPVPEPDFWLDSLAQCGRREENNVSPTKRTRNHTYTDSSDDDEELGFTDRDEDRTITARMRPRPTFSQPSPPPPVPSLPTSIRGISTTAHEPFPRSPTDSTISSRNAVTSASNLALRRTMSGASSTLALLPPSPPIHRERRRLRKKSRPPHLENTLAEAQERSSAPPDPSPIRPSTPERPSIPPVNTPQRQASQKVPLMTRIGSVKRWGARKKRDSTTPSESMQEAEGEDSTPQTAKTWFFRNTGTAHESVTPLAEAGSNKRKEMELRHAFLNSKSDLAVADNIQESPVARLSKRRSLGFVNLRRQGQPVKEVESVQPHLLLKSRRPTSMQPYAKPRDVSHSGTRPMLVAGSMSVEDLGRNIQRHSSRNASGTTRKVSLTNSRFTHKRTQSSGATGLDQVLPVKFAVSEASRTFTPDQKGEQPPEMLVPPQLYHGLNNLEPMPAVTSDCPSLLELPTTEASRTPLPAIIPNMKASPSPQTASLGRSTPPVGASKNAAIPRRNSLSDLKIPTRISEAQVGLRRDLKMVREFAANVEQLKALEATYASLTEKVRSIIDAQDRSYSTSSGNRQPPTPFKSRPRSNTDTVAPKILPRHLASTLDSINSRYLVAWECAGLLIELGGGTRAPLLSPPVSASEPVMASHAASSEAKKNRERAITLSGEGSKLSPISSAGPLAANTVNIARHASTERNPLQPRKLHLLEEILRNNITPSANPPPILEESMLNREWRWGDAMNSTVTLPSETNHGIKKKRSNRLRMSGLRNMLRSLKRNYPGEPITIPIHPTTDNTDKNLTVTVCQQQDPDLPVNQRRRAKTTAETQPSYRVPPLSTNRDTSIKPAPSSRRPSLASIFRLGQRNKPTSVTSSVDNTQSIATQSSGRDSCSITDDGDWDRLESSSDLDAGDNARATNVSDNLRGRSPFLSPNQWLLPFGSRNSSKSQSSITPEHAQHASSAETEMSQTNKTATRASPSRPRSRTALIIGDSGMRPAAAVVVQQPREVLNMSAGPRLAMTPENIEPLLENSKDVISRLQRCIAEMHLLLDADNVFDP